MKNSGWEVAVDTRIIDEPSFAWDLTVSGSTTKNKVLELGRGRRRRSTSGFYQQHRAGYPLGGFWSRTAHRLRRRQRRRHHRRHRVHRIRHRRVPGQRAPDQGAVGQYRVHLLQRPGPARRPGGLPRRAPGGQLDRELPLHAGAQLPGTGGPHRAARGAGPRGGGATTSAPTSSPSSSRAGSSSCARCRSPSSRPTAGRARSAPTS